MTPFRERLMDFGSGLFLVGVMVYTGFNLLRKNDAPPSSQPVNSAALVADSFKDRVVDSILVKTISVDSAWLSLKGSRATAVYLFRTTCQACQSQRTHIGDLLSGITGESILTVASEPPQELTGYWPDGVELPLTIHGESIRALGVTAVPSWVFVAPDGRIHDVVVGVTPRWTRDSITNRLRSAETQLELSIPASELRQ